MYWWLMWIEHFVFLYFVYKFYRKVKEDGFVETVLSYLIFGIKSAPIAQNILKKEINKSIDDVKHLVQEGSKILDKYPSFNVLPPKGLSKDEIVNLSKQLRGEEKSFNAGKAMGGIYEDQDEHYEVVNEMTALYNNTNALYPFIFNALPKMEREIVQMTLNLLEAPETGVGSLTTGGSESILMAIKTYRDRARDLYGIKKPEMLVPLSAHPAFLKAAHYFGVEFVTVRLGEDFRVDVREVAQKITKNTILIIGSAPCYPYGLIDDIESLAMLALDHGIPLHVDACLGGLTLPFWDKLGYNKKKWNFKVKGVTSISADIHKYGFAPKGNSVISYISHDYRKYQFFTASYWPGGLYASPTMTGSRSGACIAGGWSSLVHLGEDGFLEANKKMYNVFTTLVEGIANIPNINLIGTPDICCIGFNSDKIDIMQVADEMEKRGWKTITRLQKPVACQVVVAHLDKFDHEKFIQDMKEIASQVSHGTSSGGSIYGITSRIPSSTQLVDEILKSYLEELYTTRDNN